MVQLVTCRHGYTWCSLLHVDMDILGVANRCKVATFHCEHQNIMESMWICIPWKVDQCVWKWIRVAQLVQSLCYMLEGWRFNSQWGHWDFSWTWFFWLFCVCGVGSSSNRNEYQGYLLDGKCGRWIGLPTLPPSCADCLESLGTPTFWSPNGLSSPVLGYLYIYISYMFLL